MDELGVNGKLYVNRKTSKTGKYVSQDNEKKIVYMTDGSGVFTVPMSTFKSFWVESKTDDAVKDDNDVIKDEPQLVGVITGEGPVEYMKSRRDIEINGDNKKLEIIVDGMKVFESVKVNDNETKVRMLPDVFTYSEIPNNFTAPKHFIDFSCKDNLSVALDLPFSVDNILQMIKDSVVEINLYGYIVE